MKRLHVSLSVGHLKDSVKFYSTLFGSEPTMQKDDYAQWILDDPRVNFSIASRGGTPGFNHVGIQAENEEELSELYERVRETDGVLIEQGKTVCCYAESNKNWVIDPQDVRWEIFHTTGRTEQFGDDGKTKASGGCCGGAAQEAIPVVETIEELPR
jgi:catechol 2,3-dioxygenase-like lactoylglutathione lyase family enzyme